jgi:hypothetical protein
MADPVCDGPDLEAVRLARETEKILAVARVHELEARIADLLSVEHIAAGPVLADRLAWMKANGVVSARFADGVELRLRDERPTVRPPPRR